MTRREILAEAEKCVCGDREQDYGSPEKDFNFNSRTLAGIPQQRPQPDLTTDMMALLKIARICNRAQAKMIVGLTLPVMRRR